MSTTLNASEILKAPPAEPPMPSPWRWPVLGVVAILCALAVYVVGRESTYSWGWYVLSPFTETGRANLAFLIGGLGQTLALSLLAMAIAGVLGLMITLPALSRDPWARGVNLVYVESLRSVPVLVMLLWVHYGLPVVFGLNFSVFTSALVALSLCESAFLAEVFRGGIQSIERGQSEAAKALGLKPGQTMRLVVLPQAIRRILPPLGNQFVYMLKMSALASILGYGELTRRANELVTALYRPLEVYTFLVLEYLVLILIISWAVRRLERRLQAQDGR